MAEIRSDEVSLLDLWRILVVQKKIILWAWLVCTALGASYAFLVTPVYKAEAFMLPPSDKDIQPLNTQVWVAESTNGSGKTLSSYPSTKVYAIFLQALRSRLARKTFYEEHDIPAFLNMDKGADVEVFFEESFNELLLVHEEAKTKELSGFSSLSYENKNPELITQWVNMFVEETSKAVAQKLVADVMSKVDGLKKNTKELIQSKKTLANIRRQDRIVALEEALRIAHSMSNGDQGVKSQVKLGNVALNARELPLYMLSPNALKAEIEVLKNRKDDSPFIKGLRDLEERMEMLNQISIQAKDVHVMRLDQQALVPSRSIKPKKGLLIGLAMLVGLMLGVLTAFLRNAFLQQGNRSVG